jgi:hypothetical protein
MQASSFRVEPALLDGRPPAASGDGGGDGGAYFRLASLVLEHARRHLTTDAMAAYVLRVMQGRPGTAAEVARAGAVAGGGADGGGGGSEWAAAVEAADGGGLGGWAGFAAGGGGGGGACSSCHTTSTTS